MYNRLHACNAQHPGPTDTAKVSPKGDTTCMGLSTLYPMYWSDILLEVGGFACQAVRRSGHELVHTLEFQSLSSTPTQYPLYHADLVLNITGLQDLEEKPLLTSKLSATNSGLYRMPMLFLKGFTMSWIEDNVDLCSPTTSLAFRTVWIL